jgi:hypothetical protein
MIELNEPVLGITRRGQASRGLSMPSFLRAYPDSPACAEFLFWLQDGYERPCTRCGQATRWIPHYRHPRYQTDCCTATLTPTHGTLFFQHSASLWQWFYALALSFNLTASPSSLFLSRHLDIELSTAWDMLRRIRQQIGYINALGSQSLRGQTVFVDNIRLKNITSANGNRTKASNVLIVSTAANAFALAMPRRRAFYIREVLDRLGVARVLYAYLDSTDMTALAPGLRGYETRYLARSEDANSAEVCGAMANGRALATHLFCYLLKWPVVVRKSYVQHYLDDYVFRFNFAHDRSMLFPLFMLHVAKGAKWRVDGEFGQQRFRSPSSSPASQTRRRVSTMRSTPVTD